MTQTKHEKYHEIILKLLDEMNNTEGGLSKTAAKERLDELIRQN